jgi:hypothetical protein
MSGFISSSPFQNTKRFPQIRSLAPGIARRSSGRFQLRRQLRRAITLNPWIVCGIRGYRCFRLVEGFVAARSVRRLDPRISGNRRIWFRLRRGSSSPVSSSILVLRSLRFLGFGVASRSPAPLSRRRSALPPARVRAAPAGATSGGGGAAARRGRRPAMALVAALPAWAPPRCGPRPRARVPCAAPMAMEFPAWGREERGRRRWQFRK